jgi:hypothetical protein
MPRVSDNMLSSMIAGADGPALQIGASLFAFFIIGLGIPLFRYVCAALSSKIFPTPTEHSHVSFCQFHIRYRSVFY